MPPPVDLSKVNEETERASQEAALQEAQASRPGSTQPPASQSSSVTPVSRRSSIASGSDGPRRRSPQSDQLRQKMVEELCARSAHASARYGNNAKLQDLITANAALCNDKDSAGFTPLHFAACYNHHPALALLISAKADADALNEHGWTPLHVAARNGHHKCVTALLDAKASVDIKDKQEMTALHNASCSKCLDSVGALLRLGPECIHLKDKDGWTSLHFAARFGRDDVVKMLLDHKADPNAQDRDGWTAIHNSARNGRIGCVQMLLSHGNADLSKKTRYGETPLHIACRKGKAKVVDTIITWADEQGGDLLKTLLSAQDTESRRPEDVANVSYIRLLLNRGHLIGSSYDTMVENNDVSSKDPEQTQTTTRKSRACCVM
eukprot:Tamp_19528.p1 GENE.Tamp_19528~~Tamp_19528.p1  ORF type:complete len:411 (+),score=83.58 Tamp_19528:98-1234(+)